MDKIQTFGDTPIVGLIMGSLSDWKTMQYCAARLEELDISYEKRIVSAHRTPELAHDYAVTASDRGLKVIIAAAGGAAHLAGVMAANTLLPVIGCPMMGWSTNGLDSLLSTVNMPGGIPVATMSVGKPGAVNAAMFAAAILALLDTELADRLKVFRESSKEAILETELPEIAL